MTLLKPLLTFLTTLATLVASLAIFASPEAHADELSIERIPGVALSGRNKCATILRMTQGSKKIKTLLLVAGDIGRYSMERDGELSPPPVWLLMRDRVAVAALNKPGISLGPPASRAPAKTKRDDKQGAALVTRVNDNVFMNYSIAKVVDCWVDYLKQLNAQPPARLTINRIVMLGSGEGAHVMVRLYDRLIKERSALAQKVKTLYLTGFSVDGAYRKDLPYELGDKKWAKLQKLLAEGKQADTKGAKAQGAKALKVYELMNRSRGLAWLEDLKAHENLATLFKGFHKAGSKIYFNFYQGLDDNTHDIEGNRSWEVANSAAKDKGEPHINAFVRYYTGDYGLNTAASNDIYTGLAWDTIGR